MFLLAYKPLNRLSNGKFHLHRLAICQSVYKYLTIFSFIVLLVDILSISYFIHSNYCSYYSSYGYSSYFIHISQPVCAFVLCVVSNFPMISHFLNDAVYRNIQLNAYMYFTFMFRSLEMKRFDNQFCQFSTHSSISLLGTSTWNTIIYY